VWRAGVEFNCFTGFELQVVFPQHKPERAIENKGPIVSGVAPEIGLGVVTPRRKDELVRLDPSGSAG
jgi:hypothetical protein